MNVAFRVDLADIVDDLGLFVLFRSLLLNCWHELCYHLGLGINLHLLYTYSLDRLALSRLEFLLQILALVIVVSALLNVNIHLFDDGLHC